VLTVRITVLRLRKATHAVIVELVGMLTRSVFLINSINTRGKRWEN